MVNFIVSFFLQLRSSFHHNSSARNVNDRPALSWVTNFGTARNPSVSKPNIMVRTDWMMDILQTVQWITRFGVQVRQFYSCLYGWPDKNTNLLHSWRSQGPWFASYLRSIRIDDLLGLSTCNQYIGRWNDIRFKFINVLKNLKDTYLVIPDPLLLKEVKIKKTKNNKTDLIQRIHEVILKLLFVITIRRNRTGIVIYGNTNTTFFQLF